MATASRNRLLTLATTLMLLVGIGLVAFGDYLLTVAGILLVILSAVVFMADVKALLLDTSERARG